MNFPAPSAGYNPQDEAQFRAAVRREIQLRQSTQSNIVLGAQRNLVLTSPDGSQFALTVANDGTLSATPL